ncbi:monofunctional biosynthetic peptidoglycan transglycosylase [Tropicibacter naphthalenivorans]|uniref:Biosynthetic peptidoglycan transglycosylase n=1 Tax=Tropicibacter naphthalenivorans TaxID=441103 RepID=A0A0P1GWY4_9RHOB|nr:monofunctional biosynthetic peptidoglycan transglycosylase [Tropicibacter naphthalenivorans]CUH78487.1 Penicillin-binding protein 2D [Tropicibacter naphthalenivorans]SMC80741.1 monofunctional biosynthetic peptidoglycan transglycosylase [Tropicibacter naphthalenivorans]
MAKKPTKKTTKRAKRDIRPGRWLLKQALRVGVLMAGLILAAVVIYAGLNPPTTHTMWSESQRLGRPVDQHWVDVDDIAPVMLRSVVAAEDANYCTHWGFDMSAIRAAIEGGAERGGSTISQQVVKNVYLWQDRSYVRKALEAVITPAVEAVWSKRRILEVYLNIAEFDEGVFGVEAAARHYFGKGPEALSARQAALLAAVLPSPKKRNAARPSAFLDRRARGIMDGAATIKADGRADCFE